MRSTLNGLGIGFLLVAGIAGLITALIVLSEDPAPTIEYILGSAAGPSPALSFPF